MGVNVAPVARSYPLGSEGRWIRATLRTALALLAMWAVHFAAARESVFRLSAAESFDRGVLWLAWLGPLVAAGFLFALATWLPLGRIRYLWSRLLLVALAAAPLALFWWVVFVSDGGSGGGFLQTHVWSWFTDTGSQTALAVLVGVAIASGFRAARFAPYE